MGLAPSRLSLPAFVNTLQSALSSRSNRQIEPEIQLNESVNTPAISRSRRHQRFLTRFWGRSRNRKSCSCQITEDDDYASVFGRVRRDSAQSLPPTSPVRRARPDFPAPLLPSAECRLFVDNIQVERPANGSSTYHEQTRTTTRVNSETRLVNCRHCRYDVSAVSSSTSSPCATPLPQPSTGTQPVCRACYWHSMLPHQCGCFGPPAPFLSWDAKSWRLEREQSTPIPVPPFNCFERESPAPATPSSHAERELLSPVSPSNSKPRTKFGALDSPESEVSKLWKQEDYAQENKLVERIDSSRANLIHEPENSAITTCICPMPSKMPCPCDKRLFEAMNPWNKVKTALFVLLILALVAWIIAFIIID